MMMNEQQLIKKVPVEQIHVNSWNPFSMRPELFEALVKHIKKEGLIGNVIVRPCSCSQIEGSHYEIIDGENRFQAAQDRRIALKEIDCLIEDKNDVEARLETINFNLEHGEIVKEKFDSLIKDIESKWNLPKEEIANRLFISKEELSLRLAPLKMKVDQPKIKLEAKLPTFTISARMHSRKDYEFVSNILRNIMKEEECDESSALLSVFSDWLKSSSN